MNSRVRSLFSSVVSLSSLFALASSKVRVALVDSASVKVQ